MGDAIMSASESSRADGVPKWSLVLALLAGMALGVGLAAWRMDQHAERAAEAAEANVVAAEADRDAAKLEAREARMAFKALVEEHARVRAEADGLADRLAASDPGLPVVERPSEVALAALGRARVVDVSEDLGYVVFDVGSLDGIRAGMVLNVVRDDRVVARIRASEVKETLTGASVVETEAGLYPQAGDRMVLGRGSGA